jgi:hypothetical protein
MVDRCLILTDRRMEGLGVVKGWHSAAAKLSTISPWRQEGAAADLMYRIQIKKRSVETLYEIY